MKYDLTNLTDRQQELLTFAGWGADSSLTPQPSPRTVRKLLERGLLWSRKAQSRGITWIEYDVPTHVHIAWCEHCSATEERKAKLAENGK